jgi:TonB family protein
MPRLASRSSLLAAVSLTVVSSVRAQEPLTPGTAALLVLQRPAENTSTLQRALVDPQPAVRTVAARIAAVTARRDLAPIVAEQLAREDDPVTAAEQVRALLITRGTEALADASAAAARLGVPVRLVLAEWLGRKAPGELASRLAELSKNLPDPTAGSLGRIVAMSVRQNGSHENALGRAWLGAAGKAGWQAFLDRWVPTPDNIGLISAAVASSNSDIRERTIWFVLTEHLNGRLSTVPELEPAGESGAAAAVDSEWAAVGREILARRRGSAASADLSAPLERHAIDHYNEARALRSLKELSANEQFALRKAVEEAERNATFRDSIRWELGPAVGRTFSFSVSGLIRGVLEASGCAGMRGEPFGAAVVGYRDDGRVGKISSDWVGKTPACAQALVALASLSIADPSEPVRSETQQWLLLPMDKTILACMDAVGPSPDRTIARPGSKIKPPRKTRDVRPAYPEAAQRAGIEGIVVLESTISTTGCVRGARVLRTLIPALDVSAVLAVLRWQFEPTTVDAMPVPVLMTVTVNFMLR